MSMPKPIRLNASDKQKVLNLMKQGQKIEAIKYLRDAAIGERPGLREAKDAAEHLAGWAAYGVGTGSGEPCAVVAPSNPIKWIVVDMAALGGEGEATVDLEEMLFKFSSSINHIGIGHVSALLSLHQKLLDWERETLSSDYKSNA